MKCRHTVHSVGLPWDEGKGTPGAGAGNFILCDRLKRVSLVFCTVYDQSCDALLHFVVQSAVETQLRLNLLDDFSSGVPLRNAI